LQKITPFLDSVPTLTATWLAAPITRPIFVPTHIKQIKTFAPKDMRAEKERRKEEKALARKAKKQKVR
jgi:ribonuclease P/MRP protein subunit POP3